MHTRFVFLAALLFLLPSCKTVRATAPAAADEDVVEQYPDELQVEDLVKGSGETALAGTTVTVHYRAPSPRVRPSTRRSPGSR